MTTRARQDNEPETSMGLLAEEIAFFDEHRDEYVRRYPGRHLLIHGRELLGHFEDRETAVASGYRRFGIGPFLVRQSGEGTIELSAPALSLGIPLVDDSDASLQ